MENLKLPEQQTSIAKFKPITMRERANDDFMEKVNQLTEPTQIKVIEILLDKPLYDLSYLDSTFFRDILKLDINYLAINFTKGI